VLIDSTGLPNDIHFPYTAVNNHNGVISREVRLIMVLDKNSGYPLYFKYVPGNIVDVSTMINVINELKEFNINVGHSILDAGYYCEDNITNLYLEGIQFLTRLKSNVKLYKDLAKEHLQDLQSSKYAIKYRDRLVKIKCVPVNLFGYKGYAYVSIDIDRRNDEQRKYLYEALGNETPRGEIDENMSLLGMFVLISSQELETKDILPLYYTRQAIEQVFDFCKNDVDMLPLRTHNENTFRGHLLLSFLASITYITMNKQMEGSKFCAKGVFHAARGLKCNVYDNRVIPSIPNKKFNDIIKYLKLNLKQSYEL
jgi:transposase